MTSDLRSKAFTFAKKPTELVTLGTGDEQIVIRVTGLGIEARANALKTAMVAGVDATGEPEEAIDIGKLSTALVIRCSTDPDTGDQVFGEADRELIAELSASYFDPLLTAALRLSSLSKVATGLAEKNSAAIPSSASASPSPESSG